MVKKLQWDSEFFDLKVGEISLNKPLDAIEIKEDFDLIYVLSKDDFHLQISEYENTFSETKVFFVKKIDIYEDNTAPIFSFDKTKMPIEPLYELAYESGKNSRFLLDEKFEELSFKKLHKTWVDNSINKIFADDILVFLEADEIKGFVSYKIKVKTLTIGLIAVDFKHQYKGIGAQLLKKMEQIAFEKGMTQIKIPTQLSNTQACAFYEKQGYSIEEQTYIKHFWKI
jgi:dTDP-4-amino-4,6-dideoxy-D-galactose acyltransferase